MKPFSYRWKIHAAGLLVLLLPLAGCGGDEQQAIVEIPPSAATNNVVLGAPQAGPTPFIAFVEITPDKLTDVSEVSFTIVPMAGTVSSPVSVTYAMQALKNRGRVSATTINLPVFGLYAGYANTASIKITFNDKSFRSLNSTITTASYTVDTPFSQPDFITPRQAGTSLGYNFFLTKPNGTGHATILDTDGKIRWASGGLTGPSVLFRNNGLDIGDAAKAILYREELDGTFRSTSLNDSSVRSFHHNLEFGKTGILAEFDVTGRLEDLLAEIASDGTRIKTWDMVQIFSDYMRSQGDDPASFVRPGTDWLHMNSAIYDASDDSVIISSRENFVTKIDYSTGTIKWIFGDPQKYWFSFGSLRSKALNLSSGLVPIGQHALSLLPDGQLLMFNNGAESVNTPAGAPTGASRLYSAVTGFTIDADSKTATSKTLFDDNRDVSSKFCSSVYESSDGSMLINYSQANSGTILRIKGFNPKQQLVFEFSYSTESMCNTSWNSTIVPLENLYFTS